MNLLTTAMKNYLIEFNNDMQNYKNIKLSESEREVIRDALEMYRNEVTKRLYSEVKSNFTTEYHDIMILEIDEILEIVSEEE
jgi:hypothetical protein